ncbi:MAG: hypothetical protein AAF348_19825 [Bacteroidota bacterium]
MRTRIALLLFMTFLSIVLLSSCASGDTEETEKLYEIYNVDKREIERPGDQGGD